MIVRLESPPQRQVDRIERQTLLADTIARTFARRLFTASDAAAAWRERVGALTFDERTLRRDLLVLAALGWVEIENSRAGRHFRSVPENLPFQNVNEGLA